MIGKREFRGIVKSVFVSIALVLTFFNFGTVFADDGEFPQPTTVDQAEITSAPDEALPEFMEEAESTADLLADEPAEMEPAEPDEDVTLEEAVEETLPAEEIVQQEPVSESETTPEVDEILADDSADLTDTATTLADIDITLVDEDGAAVDMTAENNLNTVSSADPWWLVGKVKYAYVKTGGTCPADTTPGVTCFESGTPIGDALTYMDDNNLVPTDGLLHVEPDTYNETTITIDGSIGNGYLSKMKGLVSEGSSADTFIIGDVSISNTLLGFTLSGFTITGHVDIHDNTGTLTLNDLDVSDPADSGIVVNHHKGAVKVERVKSDNNAEYGLYLDNTAGSAGVTVTNSEFSHNNPSHSGNWDGLVIYTNSTISLNGISACDNFGIGARLDALKGTTIKNSVFNNNLKFSSYLDYGIGVYINNANTGNHILLENVQTDGNGNFGIYFVSAGKVTLKNVNAYNNSAGTNNSGVYIDNRNGTGTVSVTNSTFKENGHNGLWILSHKNVMLNGISALDNGYYGVYVDNCDESLGVCLGTGTVTVSGTLPNYFNRNIYDGLRILSGGNIALSYFQANENDRYGIYIHNDYSGRSGNVTINLSYKPVLGTWQNTISDNLQGGLSLASFGNILVDQCAAEGNTGNGFRLDNHLAARAKSVTIKNSRFNENSQSGLIIESQGNVSLYDVEANQNTLSRGVSIQNDYGSGKVSITGSGSTQRDFSGNGTEGIYIQSAGVVTLKNIYAVGNGRGADIDNESGIGKAVSINNADFSDSVSNEGLIVSSKGAITLTDVVSSGNLGAGAQLSNSTANSAQTVKITRGQFSNNQGTSFGLTINSLGTVTLNSIQASGNGHYGASIDVCRYDSGLSICLGNGGVTITGTGNDFSNNGYIGLSITSKNSVVLNNITADNNASTGLTISHGQANCSGNVSLKATKGGLNSFSNNGFEGIHIYSVGNISLAQFEANNNVDKGVELVNDGSSSAKSVSVSYAEINDNQNTGLEIYSNGKVTLSGVQVLRSSLHWSEIDDEQGQNVHDRLPSDPAYDEIYWFNGENGQSVTIDLTSDVFDAYLELYDEEWHLIDANDNGGGGGANDAQINWLLTADQVYYIRVSSAVSGEYGDYVLGMNGASPYDVYAFYYGVNIENRSGSADVNIKSSSLGYGLDTRDNNDSGLYVSTYGNINISGVNANYNGGDQGAHLDNSGVIVKTIKLANCNFDHNDEQGIHLTSKGTITWSGGSASANGNGQGAYIANYVGGITNAISISKAVFNQNAQGGLVVGSFGNISLANVSASGNLDGLGADLNSCQSGGSYGCLGFGRITISGTYGSADFNDNSYIGLRAYAGSHISLTNVNASGNGVGDGLELSNDYANVSANITVKTSSTSTYSNLNDNGSNGLETASRGTILLSNLSAWGNTSTGIDVDNTNAETAKAVTLNRIQSGNNDIDGIYILSGGAITLSYIESLDNQNMGICLVNTGASIPQNVLVSRTKANGNTASTGLLINTVGTVTLNNITANNNHDGVRIQTSPEISAKVIVLSSLGENVFSGNETNGLWIDTGGDVSLSKVTADWNGDSGVYINADGKLTVTTMSLYRNTGIGFYADANMGMTIKALQSYNNGSAADGAGLYINMGSTSTATISNSVITGNYGDGIDLNSGLEVLLLNTYYFGNDINNTGDKNLNLH